MSAIGRDATFELRETTESDLEFLLGVEEHHSARGWISRWSRERHQAALADPAIAHWTFCRLAPSEPLGYALLTGIDGPNSVVCLQRIAVAHPGRGSGRAFLRMIQKAVFEDVGAHRLWLDTLEDNLRAQHLYRSEGFVDEGTLRECFPGPNGFRSLIVMGQLRREYRTGR